MPEKKPKENKSTDEEDETQDCEPDKSARSKDQQEKSYYYDDAYGYEVYDPNEDDDEEDGASAVADN